MESDNSTITDNNNTTMELNSTIAYTNNMAVNLTLILYNGKAFRFSIMMILSTTIAIVGIIANFTVVIAFLSHKKLRGKIPNMFIINQVGVHSLQNSTL